VLALQQQDLEEALRRFLAAKRVKVGACQRLARLEEHDDGVVASIDHLDRVSGGYPIATKSQVVTGTHQTRAAYVIGADGSRSLVRRWLGADFDPHGAMFRCGVFEFSADFVPSDEMDVVIQDEGTSGLWPLPDRRWRWTFELAGPPQNLERRRGAERMVTTIGRRSYPEIATERLNELLQARAPWFDVQPDEMFFSIEVGFERRLASRLGTGRVWIAGDAAHMMFPVGMHSMNAGYEEIAVLASAMSGTLGGDAGATSLAEYGAERLSTLRPLVAAAGAVRAKPDADAWVEAKAERIVECVPGCGEHLDSLVGQLGLERT
jgi:2-polyprenyl-6-methoxyphenol hydroxylase-like FAD-dependent oxidoreductase